MKMQARFSLYVGVVFCLMFILLLFLSYRQERINAERDAYSTCEKLVAMVAASRSYVREVLRPKMFDLVESDHFIAEGMSGSFVTRKQFDYFVSAYPDYLMKFASTNPRNPVNTADTFEQNIIKEFISDPSLNTWKGITSKGNVDYMTVAKAFRFKKMCMRCHGDPEDAPPAMIEQYGDKNGFGTHEGDVSIYSVGVPIKITFASVRNRVLYAILPTLGLLLALFYMLNSFFKKTVSVPVTKLTEGLRKVTNGDYSEHVPLTGTKEFQDLASTFNSLVDELSGSKRKQIVAERKYKDLYNNAPDMYAAVDARTEKITNCNTTLLQKLGYNKDEVVDRYIFDMYHPDSMSGAKLTCQQFIETGVVKNTELSLKCKDGSKLDVELNVSAVRDEEGNIIGSRSAWRDIKDRKEVEKQLQQAQKMEAIGTLAGGIAHDFNNILGTILGYTEMAKEDAPSGTQFQEDLDNVLLAANRATNLVKQILAFSRQSEVERIPITIYPLIKEGVKMLRSSIPTTISIIVDIDPKSGFIRADPTQIHQILMNLCTNAYHAMEETGGTLTVTLKTTLIGENEQKMFSTVIPGEYVELAVSDTGRGIGPDVIEKIFEPYFTTKKRGKGTGMGLAIIQGIMTDYGGAISVDSQQGKGSTFHLYFPVTEDETLTEKKGTEDIPRGKERILFVDDEELLAEMAKDILERLGYHVTSQHSSTEALAIFKNAPSQFDIIITDQTMPEITGSDLARRMMNIRPDIPIILCTGYSNLIDENSAKALGIKAFVLKPLTKEVLSKLIRKVLDD